MEVSLDTFVFKMIQELMGFTHLYKQIIQGCIDAMRDNYGYICTATDDEIYEHFCIAWKKLC